MVKMYLSINNNEDVILLPITPEEYEIKEAWENKEIQGLYQALNIIGDKGLSTIVVESFFPVREYPFSLNTDMYGMDYVEKIRSWIARKVPLRFVALNDDPEIKSLTINMAVTVESFDTKSRKNGDIDYSLSLKEFKFIEVS